jgi:hypothetical protein
MPVTSLAELREALRTANPGDVIELAPGEYRGPILIETPVTLRGLDRKTVLWRRGGPVIYVRTPGVTLAKLLIERTVQADGPLIVHDAGCAPRGGESKALEALISLGDLVPGSPLTLPLEVEVSARAEIAVTGFYGAQISPSVLDSPGKHLVWLRLDGSAIVRGEILLGEISLREGNKTHYIWISGTVLDAPPTDIPSARLCLGTKKSRLFFSGSAGGGMMLDDVKLALLDGGQPAPGLYAFVQYDAAGLLSLHVPGEPPAPISVNGREMNRWSRVLLKERDTVKIGSISLTVQTADLPFVLEPEVLTFDPFDDSFPEALALTLNNGKTAWKGSATPAVPWLDVIPGGDFRVPPSRNHSWTIQLNAEALALPNGPHNISGGILVAGANAVVGVDVRLNVGRPDVALRIDPLEISGVEAGWPTEQQAQTVSLLIGNLGRGTWTGTVRSDVAWLEVVTPMPVSCGAWSEVNVEIKLAAGWESLPIGTHEIANALTVISAEGEQPQSVAARIEIAAPRAHLTALTVPISFENVERNAPLPTTALQIRNDGGAPWTGTIRAANNWVQVTPLESTIEPGTAAEFEISLLDVPAELALDTPVVIDEIHVETAGTDSPAITIPVQLTVVELPPYLVASPVHFPPFVRGDSPPEAVLRIYNNGPARWRGEVIANKMWLNVPDTIFTCEPSDMIEVYVSLNHRAADELEIGFKQWHDALSITGAREPVSALVQVDVRDAISELHLDTPILNFGQVDGSTSELPTQTVRLVNAGPAAWTGRVELCVPWLSLPSPARTFDLDVPGMSVAEFAVMLNESARWLRPGLTVEDHALIIRGREGHAQQQMTASALFVLSEWSPLLIVTPEKLTLAGDSPQVITVRNTGTRPWSFRISAASWLTVAPAEFMLDPGLEKALEVKHSGGKSPGNVTDPRAIVIVGPGREVEVEVQLVEPIGPIGPVGPAVPPTPPGPTAPTEPPIPTGLPGQ